MHFCKWEKNNPINPTKHVYSSAEVETQKTEVALTERGRRKVGRLQNYREINSSRNWGIFFYMMLTPTPALNRFDWSELITESEFIGYI